MKALQIVSPRQVEMADVPMPQIERPNQVLVRIRATSICNMHEWKSFTNHYRAHFKCTYPLSPGYPGHEGCGEIVQAGETVRDLKVGDKVFLTSHAGHLHKEYVVCPSEWAFRLEPNVSWADAAPMELFASALGLIAAGKQIAGCRCVVAGLGPGGLAVVQMLRAFHCAEIICVDLVESRLQKALDMGADAVINANDSRSVEHLVQRQFETAIDCSGSHEGIKLALRLARCEALLFGYNDEPVELVQADWFVKQLVIRTGNILDQSIAKRTAVLLKRGLIQPSALISHRVPFSDAGYAEAMDLIEKRTCYKVLMEQSD